MKKYIVFLIAICCFSGFSLAGEEKNNPKVDKNGVYNFIDDIGVSFKKGNSNFKGVNVSDFFLHSEKKWEMREYEEAVVFYIIGISRLRSLTVLSQENKYDVLLEKITKERANLIAEWMLGDISKSVDLINLALQIDDELLFPELETLSEDVGVGTLGERHAISVGRKPYIDLVYFLTNNKTNIYKIRKEKKLSIREQVTNADD